MAEETAEAWCDAWEGEGERLSLDRASSEYWTLGLAWTRVQRATRKLPEQDGAPISCRPCASP